MGRIDLKNHLEFCHHYQWLSEMTGDKRWQWLLNIAGAFVAIGPRWAKSGNFTLKMLARNTHVRR